MCKTFILVTQEAEKLGAKHLPVYFETPCTIRCYYKIIRNEVFFYPFENSLRHEYFTFLKDGGTH